MTNDGRITSGKAAAILGVSQRTFNRYVSDGDIEPIDRVPGSTGARLFSEAAIRRLARQRLEKQRAALDARAEMLGGAA